MTLAGPVPYDEQAALADLDADELARRDQLHLAADRLRFAAAHATLRRTVGEVLGQPGADLPLRRTPYGAPYVESAPRLGVSLTHSGWLVAAAVSPGPVGVDVEAIDAQIDDPLLIRRFCRPDEVPPAGAPDRHLTLLRVWVRKEAVAKALGRGLDLPLTDITVAGRRPAGPVDGLRRLRLHDLAVPDGYLGAVAVTGRAVPEIRDLSPTPVPAGAPARPSPSGPPG